MITMAAMMNEFSLEGHYTELDKTVKSFDFKHLEMIQIHEDNIASRSDLENIGVEWYQRHRHYRRWL